MTDAMIRSLLLDLHAFPTSFDAAPVDDQGDAIECRRLDEIHACKGCGRRAHVAYVATSKLHPGAGPRWLDLCPECARKVRIELDRMETVADDDD